MPDESMERPPPVKDLDSLANPIIPTSKAAGTANSILTRQVVDGNDEFDFWNNLMYICSINAKC